MTISDEAELIDKIKKCIVMSELDKIRSDFVSWMNQPGVSTEKFYSIQKVFISQKNKIIRNGRSHK